MRKVPYRVWLPVVFGVVAAALMAGDWHTQHLCIGYDAGRPFWPCEAPQTVLSLLDGPGIAMSRLAMWTDRLRMTPMIYAVQLPFVLVWWWFVGTRLDFGLLGVGRYLRPRLAATLLAVISLLMACLLGSSIVHEVRWWMQYGSQDSGFRLQTLGTVVGWLLNGWPLVIGVSCGWAAVELIRGKRGAGNGPLMTRKNKARTAQAMVGYLILAGFGYWHVVRVDAAAEAESDLRAQIIRGQIVDDGGLPVSGIEVDLVPVLEDEKLQRYRSVYAWTDSSGSYALRPSETGEYVMAVLWDRAPNRHEPFMTRFYPDAATADQAVKLTVTDALHTTLNTMSLKRLQVVKVPVEAEWSNGKPEPDATFSFVNTLYPRSGAIGMEGFQPDPDGTVLIPANFDYLGSAQVECDAGAKIASPYTHDVPFSTRAGKTPMSPLKFVLPGMPCKVWHSK